ncbi:MAG: MaoC/PaaZ C-terminal domain-containing protein [Anaerolineae bacterium]|jgi:acyl dehydratase
MAERRQPRGLTFEEFEIGDAIESPARTITEADIVAFAGLSGDYNPLHTDAEYAKGTRFGERVAHGPLGIAVASGLAWRTGFLEGTVEALTAIDWKFRGPIRIGDTVRVQAEVSRKKEMSRLGGGFVIFSLTLLNQNDEVVQKGKWNVLVRGRAADEGGEDE